MEKKQIEIGVFVAEVFLMHPGLKVFMKRNDRNLFRLRYLVTKIKNKLEDEMKAFNTSKEELIEKYCEKKDGKPIMMGENAIKIDPKYREEMLEAMKELNDKIKLPEGYNYIVDDFENNEEKYGDLTGDELEMLLMLTEK